MTETLSDLSTRHARERTELKLRQLDERAALQTALRAARKAKPALPGLEEFIRYTAEGDRRKTLTWTEARIYATHTRTPLATIKECAARAGVSIE